MSRVNSLYMPIRGDENLQSDLLYISSMFAKSKIERMRIIPILKLCCYIILHGRDLIYIIISWLSGATLLIIRRVQNAPILQFAQPLPPGIAC